MAAQATAHQEPRVRVEGHSLDYVPDSERHGKPWQQLPFWFASGCGLTSAAIGFIGPSLGMGMVWSIVAVAAGMAFGTIFMALHANQGPRLGIPQMVQSRAQFGYRGAVIPVALAVLIYMSLTVFTALFTRSAFNDAFNVNVGTWFYPVFVALVVIIAVAGFDFVHVLNRWGGYLSLLIFVIMNVLLVMYTNGHPAAVPSTGFQVTPFLVQFAAAAGYQIAYVVYTSDYTRYLPKDVPAGKLMGYVFSGATLGPAWLGCLGVVVAAYVKSPDAIGSFQVIGNTEFSGFGTFLLIFELLAFTVGVTPCLYGAVIDAITAADTFKRVNPTARLRVIAGVIIGAACVAIAMGLPDNLIADYNTTLTLMLYFLIPWTAVNLVDYYVVRRGKYVIEEIFKPSGLYGGWNWRGLASYFIGIAAMIPFYVLSFYTGPAARALGGADISFVVGIVVSAVVYYVLARTAVAPAPAGAPLAAEAAVAPSAEA